MPTYDYHCAKCKTTYETRESFSAPSTHKCQECGKGTAKRVLTAPRIMFKGSGWYATDSKSKSVASSDGDSSSGSSDTGSSKGEAKADTKAESKSESKPAAKSESKPTASAAAD
ncbi:MAG: FmdB family zinc ribbon protein [Dehalococcoidia bacterium]